MERLKIRSRILFILIIILSVFSSCKDEEETSPKGNSKPDPALAKNIAINNWIKAVMEEAYYWLEDMKTPIANTARPESYFV